MEDSSSAKRTPRDERLNGTGGGRKR